MELGDWLLLDYIEMYNAFAHKTLKVGSAARLTLKDENFVAAVVGPGKDKNVTEARLKTEIQTPEGLRNSVYTNRLEPFGWTDGWDNRPGGGFQKESVDLFLPNVKRFVEYQKQNSDKKIIAFCHGGVIRNAMTLFECKYGDKNEPVDDDKRRLKPHIGNVDTLLFNVQDGKACEYKCGPQSDNASHSKYWQQWKGPKLEKKAWWNLMGRTKPTSSARVRSSSMFVRSSTPQRPELRRTHSAGRLIALERSKRESRPRFTRAQDRI